ncbi:hypothetical protein N7481_008938 [Penicillium waksmanii]|uniref:uncharacterized protein n=1 Tax=Penicillium waksmanii TaxID=69791 RepID=UPI0025491877|nr:uncharacterized protein N7481_008938 [Penicillium waksmanii]KAJ5975231.1 hypothetical protein N7481_008938 [Penicillium waksmanii]
MGNSQTKESRSSTPRHRSQQWSSGTSDTPGRAPYQGPRSGRSSRPDLSLLGIGSSSHDREVATLEHRRETKQEREARRLEKERVARVKERERSMRDEHVDGGYLVTQGVYVGTEDFNKAVVRQLMIERRLAPFWRGLNDFSESWAEHQLMAAARGMSIPLADEIPPELEYTPPKAVERKEPVDMASIQHLTVPITSRSQSDNSDISQASNPAQSLPSAVSPIASGTSASPLFRTRAKTLAALTTSKHGSQTDLTPRELQLPRDPFVNGQPIEVNLYKDASECPICFLYYPPYLNRTRCCDQPICSECFVQIKRPDPHTPEHGEPDSNAPDAANGGERTEQEEGQLVSEPSACPFCVQPEFGVTYPSPTFRRGLTYVADASARPSPNITSPVSSTSSLASATLAPIPGRRRATSLSATDPTVVTTDRIRPDWAQKLANARAHAAPTPVALVSGRRGLRRATHGDSGRSGSPALNALAFLTERQDRTPRAPAPAPAPGTAPDTDSAEEGAGAGNIAPPRDSSRRTRIDDLEEMMMMEAIRLSLASEEDRRRRDEKEVRKEAKRREKEAKKADKVARKAGLYSNNTSTNASSAALQVPGAGETSFGRVASSSSSIGEEPSTATTGKGKGVERGPTSAAGEQDTTAPSTDLLGTGEPSKQSQLRHVSSAASSASSLIDNTPEERTPGHDTADGSNMSLEPMFNFRSLAAVIGDEEKGNESEHVEDTSHHRGEGEGSSSASPSLHQPSSDTGNVEPIKPTAVSNPHVEDTEKEGSKDISPKELETRSVEITNTPTNTETTS